MNEKELLAQLAQPFEPKHITWKPGATSGEKCLALAYADLRAYQERLDTICGLDWSIEYLPWGDSRVIARLTIGGITRSSTGEMSNQDIKNEMGGTVAEAQAMKRAAAQFGLGRYLYDLPSVWVAFDASKKRITEQGRKELDSRYAAWYSRQIAQQAPQATQRTTTPDATTTPPDAPQRAPVAASEGVDNLGDELFDRGEDSASELWYVAARGNLTNGTAALADKMLELHRNGQGPCSDKQYQYLSGLIDSLPGVGKDGHAKVLSVICQNEISGSNRPSFDLTTKLLDYLPTHTKVDGNKVVNPNYRADIVEHITKIANALQMALPLAA